MQERAESASEMASRRGLSVSLGLTRLPRSWYRSVKLSRDVPPLIIAVAHSSNGRNQQKRERERNLPRQTGVSTIDSSSRRSRQSYSRSRARRRLSFSLSLSLSPFAIARLFCLSLCVSIAAEATRETSLSSDFSLRVGLMV